MRIDILHKADNGEEPYLVGTVARVDHCPLSAEKLSRYIREAWVDFMATEPDSDSDFIPYLAERFPLVFAEAPSNHTVRV